MLPLSKLFENDRKASSTFRICRAWAKMAVVAREDHNVAIAIGHGRTLAVRAAMKKPARGKRTGIMISGLIQAN